MSKQLKALPTPPATMQLFEQRIEYPFSTADETTDIEFIVEEKRIYFTKAILTVCSPVFRAMFTGNFIEKEAKEIPLLGKKYVEMVEFFKHLHSAHGPMTLVTDGSLLSLLSLAEEYQVTSVKEKCKQYISQQARLSTASRNLTDTKEEISVDSVLTCLLACDRYKLLKYKEQPELVQVAAWKGLKKLTESPIYASFENNSMIQVMRKICEARETLLDQHVSGWKSNRLSLPWRA